MNKLYNDVIVITKLPLMQTYEEDERVENWEERRCSHLELNRVGQG